LGSLLDLPIEKDKFNFIFDKATLDCLLSGYSSKKQARKYLEIIFEGLSEDGVYFYVTNGKPENRLNILKVR
jgi:hypothetical protein